MKKLKFWQIILLIILWPIGIIYLVFWIFNKIKRNKFSSDVCDTGNIDTFTFNVAGVTFKNGRKSRQTILRQIKYKDSPFDQRLDVKLEQYDFEGRPAISVTVNGEMIGNVPKEHTDFFLQNADKMLGVKNLEIVGGGTSRYTDEKLSYGAKITVAMKKKNDIATY